MSPLAPPSTVDDAKKKAYELAADTSKQVIALSTGIVTVTIAFVKDVFGVGGDTTVLFLSWGAYVLSIVFGILTMQKFAGNLEKRSEFSIYEPGLKALYTVQFALFILATIGIVWFGV